MVNYRPWQLPVIQRGVKSLSEGSVYAIQSPTGSGKTLMALDIAFRLMQEGKARRVVAVERTRNQMLSYSRDLHKFFPNKTYTVLISKTDTCPYVVGGADPEDIDCKVCSRSPNYDLTLAQLRSHGTFEAIDILKKMQNICPYYSLRGLMYRVDLVVLTYPYLFSPITRRAVKIHKLIPDSIFIVDEAHNLDKIGELLERTLTIRKIRLAKAQAEKYIKDTYMYKALIRALGKLEVKVKEITSKCEEEKLTHIPKKEIFDVLEIQDIAAIYDCGMAIRSIMQNLKKYHVNWVLSIYRFYEALNEPSLELFATSDELVLKLTDPAPLLDILNHIPYLVLMSGTLPPREYMEKVWGLKKPIDYVDVDKEYGPVFPEENKKWIIAEDVDTRYANRKLETWLKYSSYLRRIYFKAERNVLAVTPSYKVAHEISLHLRDLPLIVEDKKTRLDIVQEKIYMKNTKWLIIAVAQGKLAEGVEFTDPETGESLLSDIVLVGIPYPQPDDYHKMRSARILQRIGELNCELNEFDITMHVPALITVKQALGRAIRSRRDKATFWLLDKRYLRHNWLEDLDLTRDKIKILTLENILLETSFGENKALRALETSTN